MRALLDTHVLLWFANGDERLSPRVRQLLQSKNAELLLSSVSVAEIAGKFASRKLNLSLPPVLFLQKVSGELRLIPLPLTIEHAIGVADLAMFHRDPFDRLLAAQSRAEDLVFVTNDPVFPQYMVKVFW